jgi:hypothetical protein
MIDVGVLRNPRFDPLWRDPWPMFRAALVRSFWVVLFGTGAAFAQDPPPLEGPASEPSPPKASSPPPPPAGATQTPATTNGTSAPGASQPHSMLVIPGVTAPTPRTGGATRPKIAQPARSSDSGSPASAAPSVSAAGPSSLGSPFRSEAVTPAETKPEPSLLGPIPLTLEPLDDDSGSDQKKPAITSPRTTPGQPRTSTRARESDNVPVETQPAPRRLPGFLGRLLGQPPASAGRDLSNKSEATGVGASKSKSAPDPDTVAKRRIEQQIRATLGDKVQGVQVRVSGRNVLIVAKPTRFWQKRGVYRALETLPALAGFRARIDLDN